MNEFTCPMCSMSEVLKHPNRLECETCGHEWENTAETQQESTAERIVKDANGNVLVDGDSVTLLKDLKLKGSNQIIKGGTKVKSIRLVEGDHEISCKIEWSAIGLKACFVKKA